MESITIHTHTTYCAHAQDTMADMVDAASRAGITTMAVTEHYPLTVEIDPRRYVSMRQEDVQPYLEEIEVLRGRYPRMEILSGIELDWLGRDEDRSLSSEDFSRFDVILGSVHFVNRWPFDDPAEAGKWQEVGPDGIWRDYFGSFCEAASDAGAPFTIMAHPDLVKKFGYKPSFDPIRLYKEAAEAVQAGGRMIEVNTSGTYYACHEMFPSPTLLREFRRAGIPCTVGTDAHEKGAVARDIDKAYRLMHDAGYREVTVPMRGGGNRTMPIE